MPLGYESTIYCDRRQETLEDIMQQAVNQYLSSNPKVSVIERNNQFIKLKIPVSLRSWGEKIEILVKEKSFLIRSESSVSLQGYDWGKNHNNVRTMYTCLENAIGSKSLL
jgi:uncharacterized protein (DUF1499 family)